MGLYEEKTEALTVSSVRIDAAKREECIGNREGEEEA